MYEVPGTLTSPTPPHPTPPQNSDIQKRAFYERGFRSAGINIYMYVYLYCIDKTNNTVLGRDGRVVGNMCVCATSGIYGVVPEVGKVYSIP